MTLGERKTAAAAAVSLILWASAFVVIRSVGEILEPGPLAFARLLVGSVVLTLFSLRRRIRFPRGRALALVVTYGVVWFAGYTFVLNWAERHLDAGTASMLVQLAPLLVAAAAGLAFGEGFPRPLLVGLAIAFFGVVLIAIGTRADGTTEAIGVGLGLLAAVLYAAGVLLQKLALPQVDALTATWLGCTTGVAATAPFAGQAWSQMVSAPASDVVAVLFLGVGPTAIAFTTWAYALSRMPAGRLTATTLVVPAMAIALSWLMLGEVPALLGVVGGIFCILGVLATRRRPRQGGRASVIPLVVDATKAGL